MSKFKEFFSSGLSGKDINVTGQKYYGDSYSNLRNADPYANYTYHMGPFEKFLSFLGFRTKFNEQQEQLALSSQAYQADVSQKQYDEQYNSPVEQSARMRAAGLNPDLTGSDAGGTAASMSSEDNPMQAVASSDIMGSPQNFASFIMTALTSAVGFAKDIKGLKALELANESQNVSNAESRMRLAFDSILNYTPSMRDLNIGDSDIVDGTVIVPWKDDPTTIYNRIKSDYKDSMSRKEYRSFMANVSNMIDSLPVEREQYKQWRERAENRKGYFRATSGPDYSESDETIFGVSQLLSALAYKVEKGGLDNQLSRQSVESAELANKLAFEGSLDPQAQAESVNAENRYNIQNKESAYLMEESLNKIMSYLKGQSEKGNRFASIALAIISLGRLMSVSMSGSAGNSRFSVGM